MRLTARPADRARYSELLTVGTGRDILLALLDEPRLTSADLSTRTGRSLATVREHLGRAEACDLTDREHLPRGKVVYTLTQDGSTFAVALRKD